MFCRVNDQGAPTATDVEQTLAGTQAQLAAEIIEFAFLRRVEVVVLRDELGAGINHSRIEPETVKIIRDIVMKRDCAPIALQRVLLAAASREQLPRGASHCCSKVLVGRRSQQCCQLPRYLPITETREH